MELIEKYLRYLRYEKNYSSHTEISYLKDIAQFKSFLHDTCEDVPFVSVEGDMVRQWIVSLMEEGMTARSVGRKLSALKSFYRFLMKEGVVSKSPLLKVMAPKMNKPIPSFVNSKEMDVILDDWIGGCEFESLRDRVIVELFYMTGIRRAELIGLKDSDLDPYTKTLRVFGKRKKERLIPLSDPTLTLLEAYLQERSTLDTNLCGRLFVRENGEALYPMLVHRIVSAALSWIPTLEKKSPHVLRHTFATGMLNNGAELSAVKELLGHSSLASTEVYTHTSFEELKKIYSKAHPRA